MTDGRWSVGIVCSPTGDEDVILYDGQQVSVWDVVEILNRSETDDEMAKIMRDGWREAKRRRSARKRSNQER